MRESHKWATLLAGEENHACLKHVRHYVGKPKVHRKSLTEQNLLTFPVRVVMVFGRVNCIYELALQIRVRV